MFEEEIIKYIETLTAKVVVLENLTRSLLVEKFLEENHPISSAKDFVSRAKDSMSDANPAGASSRAQMLAEENLDLSFDAVEKGLRSAGALD